MNDQGVDGVVGWGRGNGRAARAALVAACAGLLWAGGCGRDAGEQTLSDASITLASLNTGAGSPMPQGTVAKGFQEVITQLEPLTAGSGELAADASLLVSSAQRGLGLQAAGEAVGLQRQGLSRLPLIRAELEAWKMHNAAAAAAGSYDPAPEFARIDQDVRSRQDEAQRARTEKASIDAEISGLLEQVASRLSEAATLRGEAGALRLRIPGVSETEGLALTEQIRELSRKADGLEFEARGLKTGADHRQVDLRASEVSITKLESQITVLAQSRKAVQARQAAAAERAAAARGAAQQAANSLAGLVDTATGPVPPALSEIMTARGGELELTAEELFGAGPAALTPFVTETLAPVVADAVSRLEVAASTARKAQSLRRSGSQVAIGEARQSLGDVRWSEANGLATYAQVLDELASAQPQLPSAAEYASRAQAAREASVAAKQAAFEAYQDAKSAYESSGAKGAVADRIGALGVRLNEISRVVGAGVMDAEAMNNLKDPEPAVEEEEAAPVEEPAADAPEAAADPVAELRAAIGAATDAMRAGDMETAIAFLHPATPEDEPYVEMLGGMVREMGRLDAATAQAFGQSFSAWSEENPDPMLAGLSGMGGAGGLDPEAMDIRVRGDEAVALTGNAAQPELEFRRVDGEWKQVVAIAAESAENPMAASMVEVFPRLSTLFGALADDVEAGDLESNAAVVDALKARLMTLMQPPGGG